MAYPAMLSFMPVGIMGLVVTSLVAAYMSTLSTMLNLGASYVVNDFYLRFIRPESTQKHLVNVGRVATVAIMVIGGYVALQLENALQTFSILLQIGAGTGLIYILRWYWWRINAISEIVAMSVSFMTALYLSFVHPRYFGVLETWQELVIGITITTLSWVFAALISTPTDSSTLKKFVSITKAPGPGWYKIREALKTDDPETGGEKLFDFQAALLAFGAGVIGVYGFLFGIGKLLFAQPWTGAAFTLVSALAFYALFRLRSRY